MTCKVIPALRLPRGLDIFDYTVPDAYRQELCVGAYVLVPFRDKKVPGLVLSVDNETEGKKNLKSIERVLPFRLKNPDPTIAFIDWLAATYYCSKGLALKTLLPPFPSTILSGKKQRKNTSHPSQLHESVLPRTNQECSWSNDRGAPYDVAIPQSIQEKYTLYRSRIRDTLSQNKQCVIFFPTIHEVELFAPYALESVPDERLAIMHSKKSDGALFETWNRALRGEPLCILGTRTAACVPHENLGCIIIDQSERIEHCQYDMNPRYDIREMAKKITALSTCDLLFTSYAPRLDEMLGMPPPLRALSQKSNDSGLSVINVSDEWRGGGSSDWISTPLIRAITDALHAKRGAFLFHNRKGSGSCLMCRECGFSFTCPSCGELLQPFSHAAILKCRPCGSQRPLPLSCDGCGSVRLHVAGLGGEKIAEQVRAHIPGTPVRIINADEDMEEFMYAMHTAKGRDEINLSNTIIIGTSFPVFSCPELLSSMGLIGVILADPLASMRAIRSEEEQWQILAHLRALSRSFAIPLLIQSLHPESEFITHFLKGRYDQFADWHLSERKKFLWPPYGQCIRLLLRQMKPLPSQQLSQRVELVLERLQSHAKQDEYRVLSHKKSIDRSRGHVYEITIHIPHREALPQSLDTLLKTLSDEWLIDRDPLYL